MGDGHNLVNDCHCALLFRSIQTLAQLSFIGYQPYCRLPPGFEGSSLHVDFQYGVRRFAADSRIGRAVRVCAFNAQRAGRRSNKFESL